MSKAPSRRKIRLGLLGSGTVGEAFQDFVFQDFKGKVGADLELEIVKIYTRNPKGKKWHSTHPGLFTARAEEVIDNSDIDLVVEALGFQEEGELSTFKDYIIRAFQKGKSVVTSDKAVLASFGKEIWGAAEKYGQELRFEACVGGGIPIIRSLTESFAAEEPEGVFGIVNGTCNYILSEMEKSGKSYEAALREAQEKGYAETNPNSDISGWDAEAKLILLAAITFGLHVEPGKIWRKGIEEINAIDFLYADRKGSSTIKSLAVARNVGRAIEAFVSPVVVPHRHFLASIDGPTNAIMFKGKRSGAGRATEAGARQDWDYVFVGPGAGGGPTAVALLGDVCELARGRRQRSFGLASQVPPGKLSLQSEKQIEGRFYLRFVVRDRAGIVGDICQTFGQSGVNISEIWQLSHSREELEAITASYGLKEKPEEILPFVVTLEKSKLGQVRNALEIIRRQDYILVEPIWLPIWGTS